MFRFLPKLQKNPTINMNVRFFVEELKLMISLCHNKFISISWCGILSAFCICSINCKYLIVGLPT